MAMRRILMTTGFLIGWSAAALPAQDAILPASVIFATSTGYWEDDGNAPDVERAPTAAESVANPQAKATQRHGYYKLFAVRQADRTSKVYLQQIAQTETGPTIASTVELQEISDLKPYITDIRPENSNGIIKEPGLFATIYLKTDPNAEPDGWTVLIDEFGDITVQKATN
ncbi:hypothetical protein B5K08_08600 [Rhizobium leguminosarum bv. trifolii]|uniref:Uncharacterized protein n=1 Tax=Rhizobium leguminosarum bv. trifolii TaxID=386 RepID=A0A3E1BTR1_RHILT|nr:MULTISPECIES: hypothetical protein [Rhizobium]ANM10132.1 hypothetical protein AMK05_CH01727 [Rhizobium sp. N324]ANM16614.1 hypothetical protein AMK06_CH01695 [Rhizobium sp. N541]ANM22999.1 hypothetical protein AMK07_CH01692 [Rhizobium sp. N941]OYD03703.1 hypothetical protein AMK08_CH101720 [Rhizobium sp. N4311]RFB96422.1 hypothetical protein B5K08_08600 [Rhizobium leguminosarum bv. trifolii]